MEYTACSLSHPSLLMASPTFSIPFKSSHNPTATISMHAWLCLLQTIHRTPCVHAARTSTNRSSEWFSVPVPIPRKKHAPPWRREVGGGHHHHRHGRTAWRRAASSHGMSWRLWRQRHPVRSGQLLLSPPSERPPGSPQWRGKIRASGTSLLGKARVPSHGGGASAKETREREREGDYFGPVLHSFSIT